MTSPLKKAYSKPTVTKLDKVESAPLPIGKASS